MNRVIRDRLARCPICSRLPDECVEELVRDLEFRSVAADDVVFRRGEPAEHMYFLLNGLVALSFGDPGKTIARIVGAGQTFGEAAICGHTAYPVTAEALEPVRVAVLPGRKIRDLLGERQDLVLRILGTLSLQLRGLVNQIGDLKTKNSAQRLAGYLLALAEPNKSTTVVRLPHRKQYLAQELGMRPETLSRALSRLQGLGVHPAAGDGAFLLQDLKALRAFCHTHEKATTVDTKDREDVVVRRPPEDSVHIVGARQVVCAPTSPVLADGDELRLVREVPLFSELPEDTIAALVNGSSTRSLDKKQMLFSAGDPAEAFFVVLSGAVKLSLLDDDGSECLLSIIGEGASFAEAAVFVMDGFPVNAEAIEPTLLLQIPRRHFVGMLKRNPRMGLCMISSLARWNLRLSEELWQLRAQTPAQRLAWFLLSLTNQSAGTATVRLHYPKFVVAARIGIRPESMSRVLARLSELGVHTRSNEVTIDDVEDLRQFAGMH